MQIYNHALSDGGVSTNGQAAGGEVGYLKSNPGAEILLAPVILVQPISQALVLTGGPPPSGGGFAVVAGGAAALSYQWRFNGTPLANGTNATYTIASVTTNQFGFYDVQVTNSYGSVTSAQASLGSPGIGLDVIPGLTVNGVMGTSARIDYSLDLFSWTTLTNISLRSGSYRYADWSAIGQPKRFYRAVFSP